LGTSNNHLKKTHGFEGFMLSIGGLEAVKPVCRNGISLIYLHLDTKTMQMFDNLGNGMFRNVHDNMEIDFRQSQAK
jgi:hypothetical protein